LAIHQEKFGKSKVSKFWRNMECKCSTDGCFQIIWKFHKNIGCGLTIAKEKERDRVRTVVVAIYEPAGIRLDIDDYIENVLPPKQPRGNGSQFCLHSYYLKNTICALLPCSINRPYRESSKHPALNQRNKSIYLLPD